MAWHRLVALTLGLTALTGSPAALAFPDGATSPSAEEIRKHISGQVFSVTLKNGTGWRLDFNSNGYFFVDVSTGSRATGQWKTEDGRICSKINVPDFTCSDARMHESYLYIRRTDGEIIKYVPK